MAKKKANKKLHAYYRGPITKPTHVASETEMDTIRAALLEVSQNRDTAYMCRWNDRLVDLKIEFGLTSGLRYLKQKRTLALIYDDSAAQHLTKYLNEFARELDIPAVQARGLLEFAPKLKLKTLLIISILQATHGNEDMYKKLGCVKPKPLKRIPAPHDIEKLLALLQLDIVSNRESVTVKFRAPDIINQVKVSQGLKRESKRGR